MGRAERIASIVGMTAVAASGEGLLVAITPPPARPVVEATLAVLDVFVPLCATFLVGRSVRRSAKEQNIITEEAIKSLLESRTKAGLPPLTDEDQTFLKDWRSL